MPCSPSSLAAKNARVIGHFAIFGLRPFKIQRLKKCVTVKLEGRSFRKSVPVKLEGHSFKKSAPVKLEGRRGTGKWEAARGRLNFGG